MRDVSAATTGCSRGADNSSAAASLADSVNNTTTMPSVSNAERTPRAPSSLDSVLPTISTSVPSQLIIAPVFTRPWKVVLRESSSLKSVDRRRAATLSPIV